jgi:type I restriction enzyme M protein
LFIERIVQLLKDGGRAAIILPDGIFGNPTDSYIWNYLKKYVSIIGIISLSHETFQPSTHTKTSILFIEKKLNSRKKIFMAIANKIGHDKNGKEIYKRTVNGIRTLDDDTSQIATNFKQFLSGSYDKKDVLGFTVSTSDIHNNIYIPESYWKSTQINNEFDNLNKNSIEITIGELEAQGIIAIKRGNEIGSRNYGSGDIPFIRTTDIVNWEIKKNPAKAISENVYSQFKTNQDIQENDILFVNDGTFLIGRSAMVTKLDVKSVIQSHIRKIRIKENEYGITPYYLFYLLNTDYVQQQISSKVFIQATLSTLGNRLSEIKLPILKSKEEIDIISSKIYDIISRKTKIRNEIDNLFLT